MAEPHWLFIVLYLLAGWTGGVITQSIIGEVVDHRSRERSRAWLREIRSRDRLAVAISPPAVSPRTSPGRAARTPDLAS